MMKLTKLFSIASLSVITFNCYALQCKPTYQGYKWDRVVMGTPQKGIQNNIDCLYNKNGNAWLPPDASYLLNGAFKPATHSSWGGTSAPGEITCYNGLDSCSFVANN